MLLHLFEWEEWRTTRYLAGAIDCTVLAAQATDFPDLGAAYLQIAECSDRPWGHLRREPHPWLVGSESQCCGDDHNRYHDENPDDGSPVVHRGIASPPLEQLRRLAVDWRGQSAAGDNLGSEFHYGSFINKFNFHPRHSFHLINQLIGGSQAALRGTFSLGCVVGLPDSCRAGISHIIDVN